MKRIRHLAIPAAALAVALGWFGLAPLTAADVSVRASLEPSQIPLGRAAQLTVEITGAGGGRVNMPQVENLEIGFLGQQSSWQMVNGLTSQKMFYFYQVVPHAEGQYTIPPFTVEAGGQKLTTVPLSLRVTPGASAPVPVPSAPAATAPAADSAASNPAAPRPATANAKPTNVGNEVAMVHLFPSKNEMYVGQLVPVSIKLYVKGDRQADLRSLPRLLGDAFTMTPPGKNFLQEQEMVDGVPYKVAIWNTAITPVKTGEFPVNVEVAIRVAEAVRQRRAPGFDDPFFDQVFAQYRMVDKNLQSTSQTWKVLALPTEGRPANFGGAIGEYNLTVKATPDKVKVGEPINVEMTVEGRGNFDRVNAPTLATTDGFKTYAPTSKIELRDELGLDGSKVFSEAVIPLKVGTLPPISFSFFNPELKQYVTRTVDAPRVAVTEAPAPVVAAAAPSSSPALAAKAREEDSKPQEPALVPIKVELTPFVANFEPVFVRPGFLAAQGLPLVALVAGFILARRRQRLENDPNYARAHETNRAVRAQLEAMNVAVSRNDVAAFFTAARRAVQHRLAEHWRIKADDISFDIISERSPELAESLKNLFLVADEIAYSGEARTDVALADWQKAIVALLSRLEKKI